MSSPKRPGLTCNYCTRQFSRREHLNRHLSSHANKRPYQCDLCEKGFNRCDLLQRHRKTSCLALPKERVKLPHTRSRSACNSCAKAKLRCSASVPCSRCRKKGISCVRKPTKSSTDTSESDIVFPETPLDAQSTLLIDGIFYQDGNNGGISPDDAHSSMFDWPFQACTPPQGLCMDFLDFSTFPVDAPDLYSAGLTAGKIGGEIINDFHSQNESSTSSEVPENADFWHGYSQAGMVQVNLWSRERRSRAGPKESLDKGGVASIPQGLPKSMLNLLNLEDILAMEDHDHVARVRPEQVNKLATFMNVDQRQPASCKMLLRNSQIINVFVQLYFEHFHPTFPLLHRATFNVLELPPLLMLATATIGARFSRIPQASTLSSVLGDILRKAINNMLEENIDQSIQIPIAQAAILNQIQMAYQGSRQLALKAQFQRSMLVTVCRGINSRIRHEDMLCHFPDRADFRDPVALGWLDRELSRRVTYAIWMIDCQFGLYSGVQPMMNLEDLDPYLPCHEALWDENMQGLSQRLKDPHSNAQTPVRLKEALDISKLADIISSQGLGLFARCITMTAIYYQWHTATTVNRSILQGASSHTGTDLVDGHFSATPSTPLVPPVRRAQWRTAAAEAITCVCGNTDTLQESQASQLLKLYHHILILLAVPLQSMCDYIGWMGTKACIAEARDRLCSWIAADTQNARRTVIHAITLFCLIRKRKLGTHSENHHLFVAFVVIWTFFSLQPVAQPETVLDGEQTEQAPVVEIDWDGQVDPQAQEAWITATSPPPLRLKGVGKLGETSGLHCILVETHRILLADQMWGTSRLFAGVLEGLFSQGTAIDV
ncbi:fungal-specific transcription factor domain-containing protein [Aspergillus unguis]